VSMKAYCVTNGERCNEPLRADELVIEVAPQRELRLSLGDSEDLLTIRLEIHPGAANLIRIGIRNAPARAARF
jgi:hypothetical protein